ncbi:FAD/NAD(P)-binding domain-containing protein [Mollisia scopiformis]|uniref:FAD/NAD(P)-binding domain-containing protein n=1 Tax=Mollisia scopiformis TaxID=149040 RepID=A0A194XEJ3_MOLSC|nr:FAD/NAD(P)-binding domain-containing protein [Mollisia scopiformis]KUJ18566.1 FAD/NAD(P)-binding domain-containing protein [Mollisia scopiformis]
MPNTSSSTPPSSSPATTRSSSTSQETLLSNPPNTKPTIVILGTGWAGWTLAQDLGRSTSLLSTHNLIILSPTRTMALTPLLASAACSIFDFRIAEEPVRRLSLGKNVVKYQVWCTAVDFESRVVKCKAAIGSNGDEKLGPREEFEVRYDKLILAPGAEVNTFGTPGVEEHCLFMKSVADAMKLRERILDCFEMASLPTFSVEQKREILHFVIVGGGPTGVELAAEIDELVHGHLLGVYKELEGLVTVSVYDIADRMLGQFGEKLSEYAMEKFRRRDVRICMGKHIQGFEKGVMNVKEDGEVKFGTAVWCTGNKAGGLVEDLEVKKDESGQRMLTDRWLRVLSKKKGVVDSVFALGDAADIEGGELPTTAEVAVQKAKWLAKYLIAGEEGKKFEYTQKAVVAYIGRHDGVVEGKSDWTGAGAWLAWRSGSLEWTRNWRRRAMIILYWVMNKLDGREIARR